MFSSSFTYYLRLKPSILGQILQVIRQRWSQGPNVRGQAQELKKKKTEAKANDWLFEDRPFSRPRTGMLEAKSKNRGNNCLNYDRQFFFVTF